MAVIKVSKESFETEVLKAEVSRRLSTSMLPGVVLVRC